MKTRIAKQDERLLINGNCIELKEGLWVSYPDDATVLEFPTSESSVSYLQEFCEAAGIEFTVEDKTQLLELIENAFKSDLLE